MNRAEPGAADSDGPAGGAGAPGSRSIRDAGLCYLIHTFPGWSTTFIVDEIELLRASGWNITIFAVRRPRAGESPSSYARYEEETRYLFPLRLRSLFRRHVRAFAARPVAYARTLRVALTGGALGPRDRIRTLVHFLEAVHLYEDLVRAGCKHLHVHFASGGASIAMFLNELVGMPYSLTAHGTDILVERVLVAEKVRHARFTRVATERNRRHITSQFRAGPPGTIHVIPFGIDVSRFSFVRRTPPASPLLKLLNVGRLVWQKNQEALLEAVARLRDDGVRLELTIVGEGNQRARLERSRERLRLRSIVHLPGAASADDVLAYYRDADLFVFSSASEGFGLAVVEAMASGLAVIAPALPGMDEIICDGVDGRLYPPGSVDDLVLAIRELASNEALRERIARAGALKARQRFDNRESVRQFAERLITCAAP